jgi:hypothetical protein
MHNAELLACRPSYLLKQKHEVSELNLSAVPGTNKLVMYKN